MNTISNNDFVGMLKSISIWDVKHEIEYPEIDSGVVEIKDHLLFIQGTKHNLLVNFDAIVSVNIGKNYLGSYTEAPYSDHSEISDVNIDRIVVEIYDQEDCDWLMKNYQKKQFIELVEKKIKSEIKALC
jgi:hypothetical protein